jgi:prolipoprotein diacylglyceryltransferase
LYDLLGIDWPALKLLNSFGFFVALAFVTASFLLTLEIKRKTQLGIFKPERRIHMVGEAPKLLDIIGQGIFWFIVGWKLIYLLLNSAALFEAGSTPQRHIFSGEGYLLLGIALGAAAAWLKYRSAKKAQLEIPEQREEIFQPWFHAGSITFVSAIAGLSGAKLFHLFENPDEFFDFFAHPSLESFLSGLTVYGGLIMGSLGVYLYARKNKLYFAALADAATPGMMLAYGIGRIGCQVSGDGDWGITNASTKPGLLSWIPDWMWSYRYPNNVNGVGIPIIDCDPHFEGYCTELPFGVYPTPLYETMMATLIFFILWMLRKRLGGAWQITSCYLMLNGIERFLIEQIRVNNKFGLLGMQVTQAEVIAVVFFFAGLGLFFWSRKQKLTRPAEPHPVEDV